MCIIRYILFIKILCIQSVSKSQEIQLNLLELNAAPCQETTSLLSVQVMRFYVSEKQNNILISTSISTVQV